MKTVKCFRVTVKDRRPNDRCWYKKRLSQCKDNYYIALTSAVSNLRGRSFFFGSRAAQPHGCYCPNLWLSDLFLDWIIPIIAFKLGNTFYLKNIYLVCLCVCKMGVSGTMGLPFWRQVLKSLSFLVFVIPWFWGRLGSDLKGYWDDKSGVRIVCPSWTIRPHCFEFINKLSFSWSGLFLNCPPRCPQWKYRAYKLYHFSTIIQRRAASIFLPSLSWPMTLTQQTMVWVLPKSFLAGRSTDCSCPPRCS